MKKIKSEYREEERRNKGMVIRSEKKGEER